MEHVVASVAHLIEVGNPLVEGSHPLGDDRLNDQAVERERDEVLRDDSALAGREDGEIIAEDSSTSGDGENGLHTEVSRSALDATIRSVVLNVILESSGGRNLCEQSTSDL